ALAPLPCLSRQFYRRCEDCVSEANCEIRREFARSYDASRKVLDSRTIGDALTNSPMEQPIPSEERRAGQYIFLFAIPYLSDRNSRALIRRPGSRRVPKGEYINGTKFKMAQPDSRNSSDCVGIRVGILL